MRSDAAGSLTNLTASAAAYPSVWPLSQSAGRQKEKSEETEVVANFGKSTKDVIFKSRYSFV